MRNGLESSKTKATTAVILSVLFYFTSTARQDHQHEQQHQPVLCRDLAMDESSFVCLRTAWPHSGKEGVAVGTVVLG